MKMSDIFKFIFFEFGTVDTLHNESTYTAQNMLKNTCGPIKGEVIRRHGKFLKKDASGRTHSPCEEITNIQIHQVGF